tara:strand:+ start:449 stop:673 length:225 start_codon:yes stop_codon:yes gene_type:complete
MEHDDLHLAIDHTTENAPLIGYQNAGKRFAAYGCGYEYKTHCDRPMVDPDVAMKAGVMQDLSDHPEEWGNLDLF